MQHYQEKAITEADKPVTLYLSNINFGDHRIYPSDDDATHNNSLPRSEVLVEGITLDGYFPAGSCVNFVKIDIQGAEVYALQGMKRVLRENHDVVCAMEFWPHGLLEAGASPADLLQELIQLGFILHRLDSGKVTPATVDQMLSVNENEAPTLILARKRIV